MNTKLVIEFPENLPVSARREEIAQALAAHQVIIVCGETGSGKTTQLPKIALSLGRGRCNAPPGKGKWIGHTQPRRIAASSVAKRIAEELKTPLGEVVGFKVRFQDKLSRDASVKLMTDGILLAETQTDPDLLAYDTLIIDEAHERSLNIDFLLGYLKQLLPRRPDLKIVITSATIDAERFAQHFASIRGPAPIIMVSGRMFPVEQRYRPFEESREYDLNSAIGDACEELLREGGAGGNGDVLVFLPGEREIREAADHLRKQLSHVPHLRHVEVLPLFSRLSQPEQDRIFEAHNGRRIVLATNVAETSLTVPGIRYVVDAGTSRMKRYSFRNKVEQLLVEPISQSAANQRAGRCGRVADGICIRLYAQLDFDGRERFTEPEILRSSLAGVILRMASLKLGLVDDFPFIEPPQRRAIVDGYQLLGELGAVDDANELTPLGLQLARLPLDPRVGRMLIEANARGALDEVLIIASALSVQDVRDRPLHAQAAADAAHHKFDDEKSEFAGFLKLWKWLHDARGGPPAAGAAATQPPSHKLSNRQFENLLRENFVSIRRVREWRDIHSQLVQAVQEQHWRINAKPASFEQLHLSLLAGLIGNIGFKADDEEHYQGARGIKFYRHPGANLSKKPGRWIVCAELVETARLFGRSIANVEPQWIEQVAGHLIKRQLTDPHWSKSSGDVIALERGVLYGILVYANRKISLSQLDPTGAREVFIRQGLVAQDWSDEMARRLPFLPFNAKLIKSVEDLEHKSRRQDVLVDEELIYAFYDRWIPEGVASARSLEAWYKSETSRLGSGDALLKLSRDELMRHEAAGITTQMFPRLVRLGGVDCPAVYLHEPGDAKDGVTVDVPLFALNQVSEDRCEWLVPGMLKDKIAAMLKSLPQRPRSRLVPVPESAKAMALALSEPVAFGAGSLMDAVLKAVRERTQLDVKRLDFKLDLMQPHHLMNLRVVDEHGRYLGQGRSLSALRAQWGAQARGAFAELASLSAASQSQRAGTGVTLDARQSGQNQAQGSENQENTAYVQQPQSFNATKNIASGTSGANVAAAKPAAGNIPTANTLSADTRYTSWTFGHLPELLEITRSTGKQQQTLVGFPALVDQTDAVTIEVFDEPDVAQAKHRLGLRRLVALQIKDALRYLERNLPDLQKMGMLYAPLGTADELREQLIGVALDRAFLIDPLPDDNAAFERRISDGRGRLTLIAGEVARLLHGVLIEFAAASRKLKDAKPPADVSADVTQQLARLCSKRFVAATPYAQLQHLPRYLKAITLRLDKQRSDPLRDATRLGELKPQEQRFWRLHAERKGLMDERMHEFRWLLEELRVSYFAQELRTPTPVSTKRLDKAWAQLTA